ncbi:MAG: alpha/beta fold hydrolase [Parachlamydiales bacterium]|jgi:hypothetical protein
METEIKRDVIRVDERHPIQFKVGHQNLFGMMHMPLIGQKVPAVLICHGLGGDKNGRYRAYVILARMLAENGIACMRFDYRGCGDSEGEFSQVTLSSQVEDAIAASHFLQHYPGIDNTRLGIFGRSFGGLIAVHAAAKTKAFCSIGLWSAVFNGEPWREIWEQAQMGTLPQEHYNAAMTVNGHIVDVQLWKELFMSDTSGSLGHLHDIPLLHIHGEKDGRVSVSQADEYHKIREAAQAPNHFLRLKESDHDFSNIWEREEAFESTLDWFRQTL